jgi:hypothetical protein
VPFTFVSHQAPAVALKVLRPNQFDGTALVLGSMAPDFAYALAGTTFAFNAHTPLGLVLFCVPLTIVLCAVVRARIAVVAFAQLPNTPLRLHDYRVLACRRPALVITTFSGLVGAASHALWDTFTHDGRWGSRHVALLREHVATINGRSFSVARTLQYSSHVVGAAVTIALLYFIADRRLLRRWYGPAYDDLEPVALTSRQRLAFWSMVTGGFAVGLGWALLAGGGFATQVIRASLGAAAGVTVASYATTTAHQASPTSDQPHRA